MNDVIFEKEVYYGAGRPEIFFNGTVKTLRVTL